MEIRKLTTEDELQAYWQLRQRMVREHPTNFGEDYEVLAAMPAEKVAERLRGHVEGDSFILGAFDPLLVGSVLLGREDDSRNRHKAWVWSVYVAAEGQGQGLGRKLMEATIAEARQLAGLEQIELTVSTHNASAVHLYESLGFERYGMARHSMKIGDEYIDEHLMVLWMNNVLLPSPRLGRGVGGEGNGD